MPLTWPGYIAGEPVQTDDKLEVRYPWDGSLTGTLPRITPEQFEKGLWGPALGQAQPPTKNKRYEILMSARDLLAGRTDEFANLIRLEAGLCMRETRYEVGRAQEVFKFAAAEALRDDENIFSCDAAKNGQARKIFTMREPLRLVAAITPVQPSAEPGGSQAGSGDRCRCAGTAQAVQQDAVDCNPPHRVAV
ncbi:MAG: hypothetical protein Ct9H300mP32_2190 [Verrucomicrobiota bacterium]|nr:MAG: hypothetical protein Ct9H300mP32_2190 [Verrucomicrobiota bacterium]